MSRINTNVSSLVAQKNLSRSNADLQVSLQRLSTGLRINTGKDDPAGLIASEALRSDITSTRKAITNSERANQLIATADSSLGEISKLLNDIRGLVTESANAGVLSDAQLEANQLQIDSSLEAIDRISQVTSFQGRKLLDGSLDFIIDGTNATIADLTIDQANLGATGNIVVDIDIATEATQAVVTVASAAFSGGLSDDLVIQVSGADGSEVFTFESGATLSQIEDAINLVSDATGVVASQSTGILSLTSSAYGTNALVAVEVIEEGTSGGFESEVSATRANGTDIDALVNGVQASGNGNTLSVNTATLDLKVTVDNGSSTDLDFTITGGGAIFQLGPEVVSNQQARIGITSLNTGKLGGTSGRLYELKSGNGKAVDADATGAYRVVDEVLEKVNQLRGRLGAFQRTTLESNISSLTDTLANLTEAESSIRDADFAVETAALTRSQILVQSGTNVLSIANQNPQNVLALLR